MKDYDFAMDASLAMSTTKPHTEIFTYSEWDLQILRMINDQSRNDMLKSRPILVCNKIWMNYKDMLLVCQSTDILALIGVIKQMKHHTIS